MIPADIRAEVRRLNNSHPYSATLEETYTGGGCDYITRIISGMHIVVSATDDACSPESLDAPACITIYDGEDWTNGVTFDAPNCRAALATVASMAETLP